MTYILGLTGSIGMGKTTTAQIFTGLGYPVWNADDAVHQLYAAGGAGVGPVSDLFPGVAESGAIDRKRLKKVLGDNSDKLKQLEAIVHPLLEESREGFIESNKDKLLIVMDIPLLFEKGYDRKLDGIAVVSTTPERQRDRVLSRPGMTEAMLRFMLQNQMPDAEKRQRADWVIPTDNPDAAKEAVTRICRDITGDA